MRFAAALTLTNGANLILPGATNITTAAGDVAEIVWEGSNVWRLVSYQRSGGQVVASSFVLDANAYYQLQSGNAVLGFDSNDYIAYDRAANNVNVVIGGVFQGGFNASGIVFKDYTTQSTGVPKPQTSSGLGQFVSISVAANSYTLPAGGTWAWFMTTRFSGAPYQAGSGGAGISAGGSVIQTDAGAVNCYGFAWRIA